MEEKKNFFANLQPRSALVVGIITGVLVICTVGFIVLGVAVLKGRSNSQSDGAKLSGNTTAEVGKSTAKVAKSDKPKVELFVMSYCPYGLQMEKAYLPAWEFFKNKTDMSVKFVYYTMHGIKEIEENTRQYCITKEQSDKYISYLKCFTAKDDYKACLTSVNVNQVKLDACAAQTNKNFGIMEKYNDQNTWLSGRYPLYPVHASLNQQYGVQGSPTVVINGQIVGGNVCTADADCYPGASCANGECVLARTAENVKKAVCASFNNPPSECGQTLSNTPASSGFGAGTGSNTNDAACGG